MKTGRRGEPRILIPGGTRVSHEEGQASVVEVHSGSGAGARPHARAPE
ncbi:hypothetical protein B005_3624 [Nocardiopsis alba ATCC BAA-2165]|uniref:Uncharacterized protein n=1 Tax=Nocardiopsis alba (strain ATCC BAA-2165 / BE74) TaxID=1205910 RepID=J7LBB0_NOCAA|nr:hypothetical protein B005_3624 [Nocardiopsis alba ATCC BAA-2165]